MDANEAAKLLGQKGGQAKTDKKRKAVSANLEKARKARSKKSLERALAALENKYAKQKENAIAKLKKRADSRALAFNEKFDRYIKEQKEKEMKISEKYDVLLAEKIEERKQKSQGGGGVNNSVSQSDAGLQTSPSQAHRD